MTEQQEVRGTHVPQAVPEFALPVQRTEVPERAREAAARLARDPGELAALVEQTESSILLAQTGGDEKRADVIERYIYQVGRDLGRFDWMGVEHVTITPAAARVLLLSLPDPREPKQSTGPVRAAAGTIAKAITEGYLNRRFAKSQDWRASLGTLHTFLAGSVEVPDDRSAVGRWFGMVAGDYRDVMPVHSLAWRSLFDGLRAVDPFDVEALRTANEIDWCTSMAARVLNRMPDYVAKSKRYDPLSIQFQAVKTILENGADPTSEVGQKLLRQFRQGVSVSVRTQLTPDVVELARQAIEYPGRWKYIEQVIDLGYQAVLRDSKLLIQEMQPGREFPFPYDVMLAPSAIKSRMSALADAATMRERIHAQAQTRQGEQGPSWKILPFAAFGMQGYALVDTDRYAAVKGEVSPETQARFIREIIQTLGADELWKVLKTSFSSPQVAAEVLEFDGIQFLVARPEHATKSGLEDVLDLKIPDDLRLRSLETYEAITRLRHQIPRRFTQSLTRSGDSYRLGSHRDLPGVFDSVILRRREEGGFSFTITLAADVSLSEEASRIEGRVDFRGGTANTTYEGDAEKLPLDLTWILDTVVLRLLEKSCCVPLNEDERVLTFVEEAIRAQEDVPAMIVHVGARTARGEPGTYTSQAERYFREAMEAIEAETGGLTLAVINEAHRAEFPHCGRSLTWRRGHEWGEQHPPHPRVSPERLIG